MTLDDLQTLTGVEWLFYRGDPAILKDYFGIENGKWQLMPITDEKGGDFWWWHIEHSTQWFLEKQAAIESLAESYRTWRSKKLN